jgi:hypothetical protein
VYTTKIKIKIDRGSQAACLEHPGCSEDFFDVRCVGATEGPSWGLPVDVLGAVWTLLSTFGREVPRLPKRCLKIDI